MHIFRSGSTRPSPRYATMVAAILLCTALLALVGCTGDVQETLGPDELYQRALTAFEEEDYNVAATWAQQLREEYPFNPLASDAELLEADIHYELGHFMVAAGAYQAFEELHPTHKRVDYAMLRQGLAYSQDIPAVDRDQTPSRRAATIFARLLATHPDSEHADEVNEKLAYAREQIAGHEMYVAHYYVRKDKPRAALGRLQVVTNEFSDTSHAAEALSLALQIQAELDKEQSQAAPETTESETTAPQTPASEQIDAEVNEQTQEQTPQQDQAQEAKDSLD